MTEPAPILEYACPKEFFVGAYRYGSPDVLGTAVVLAGVGLVLLVAGAMRAVDAGMASRDSLGRVCAGAVLFAAGASLMVGWASGREDRIRITEDGVEIGRKFWPWQQIGRVGVALGSGGVYLRVSVGWLTCRTLRTTPALTLAQYLELIELLSRQICPRFPHVKFDLPPSPAASASERD